MQNLCCVCIRKFREGGAGKTMAIVLHMQQARENKEVVRKWVTLWGWEDPHGVSYIGNEL